jgi:hypothetical protein
MRDTSTAVVLPCSTHDFGTFISGLLGKPQTISNMVRGPFEITREDVSNVHSLLIQRVSQQNDAVLTQFTAKLIFSDDSSVLLNSIEDFSAYNEVRPIACLALHLSWVFLVKFNDKSHPEKQQIDLSFLAGRTSPLIDRDVPIALVESDTGFIFYRISHTARTWGTDIDALLISHIKGIVNEIPKVRKWLAKHDGKLALSAFCILFLASIIGSFAASTFFVAQQRTAVANLHELTPVSVVTPQQMTYLLDVVASGTWERFLLTTVTFLLLSLVVSIGISVWIAFTADNLPPSFLLLTKASEKRKAKLLLRAKARWISFLSSIVVGIAIAIVGNICYVLWFERLITP